ncbi:MAG: efflux RND transporter periplasmic adaptor subunit [Verrucomicrobia bacterium]|nr:efflux RND transporter periplasmic adaptor subunit [Verrucomicrobiota bacterium]MCH8527164.1 efflux RND transporter periplasmic adaptor subunit [Kiritimatiellia bacterium]
MCLLSGCGRPPSGGGGPPEGDFPVNVVAAPVKSMPVRETVRLVGSLVSLDELNLSSRATGELVEIHVGQGQLVSKGDLLFSLDQDRLLARRAETASRLALAESSLERIRRLRESDSATEQELDQASAVKEQARAQMELLEAELRDTRIRAPFSGRLGERMVSVGEFVQPGTPLARLVRTDPLEVRFEVPERHLGALKEGLRVELQSEAFPDEVYAAEVSFIAPELRMSTRTVPVRATVSNEKTLLRPGMFVRVSLVLDDRPEALVVPEAAVMQRGTDTVVLRQDEDGRAEERAVRVGLRFDGMMEIREGLAEGDIVVVEGLMKARPGMKLAFSPESERFGLTVETEE